MNSQGTVSNYCDELGSIWIRANMPDPFRHYEGVPILDLPADPPMPEISAIEVLSRTKKDANWRPEKSLLSSTLSSKQSAIALTA